MKTVVTMKHLFKLTGKSGLAMGIEEPCIYFDGQHAIAAGLGATVSIDCPQEISQPVLIPVKDLKSALIVSPDLHFQQRGEALRVNGVLVATHPVDEIPADTAEILDLDKQVWRPIVRTFRLDGGRLGQLVSGMGIADPRVYLNGLYFDFATGGVVGVDGKRLHLVEDAIPVTDLPADRKQGVIMPGGAADMLASIGGVQDVFIMEREQQTEEGRVWRRTICVAAANAKFRIREVDAGNYPNYRDPFDRNRSLPINVVLDAKSTQDILAVARIAMADGSGVVTIVGEGKRITVSYKDRVQRELQMNYQVGAPFSVQLQSMYLSDAIVAASSFGSAVRMRFGRDNEARAVYVGAQDFHAIVMAYQEEESGADDTGASVADTAKPTATAET